MINILGLGLSIGVCITAFLNWKFNDQWDSQQQQAAGIYRIQSWHEVNGKSDRFGSVPVPLAENIRPILNDDEEAIRFTLDDRNVRIADEIFRANFAFADSSFLRVFTFQLLSGDRKQIHDKSTVFISDELALKYFHRLDVTGESLTQMVRDLPKEYKIGGVFKKHPLNSSFVFDALVGWDNAADIGVKSDSWNAWATLFIYTKNPSRVPVITRELQKYVPIHNGIRQDFKIREFYFDNLQGLAQRSITEPRMKWNQLRSAMPTAVVDVPSIMAVLLLLLACFNFTNTAISLAGKRLKEIGIRKVVGGYRTQLIVQFLIENLVLCFLSLLMGLLVAASLVPAYDNLWPWLELDLNYSENVSLIIFLAGLLLLTAVLAGGYSAFYITSFQPIEILKGKTRFGSTNWLTRVLLSFQFAISVLTIVFAIGFYRNAEYQQAYDLGYFTTGVISVEVHNEAGFNTYRDALTGNENIEIIAGTRHHLVNYFERSAIKFESQEHDTDVMEVGENYLEAMNIRIVQGRGFTKDSETDKTESVIVTEEFVRQFAWKDSPIGKRLVWRDSVQLYVIGVAGEIYARALFRPIEPMIIKYIGPSNYTQLVARVPPSRMLEANEFMREKWKAVFPTVLYDGQFIDNKMRQTIETNYNGVIIFIFLGFFATLMSATGLYTLVSLHILKKTKEIGIRKVMGASTMNIIGVISIQFIIIIMVASLIGGALGYVMVDFSMDTAWEYYEKVTVSTFLSSVAIIFGLAVATVGLKTISTANVNPVKSLRDD